MRQTAFIMGMPISLDIADCKDKSVFEAVFDGLRRIDAQFSPFLPGSELSRFRRGELNSGDLSLAMTKIIRACQRAEKDTDGYFSADYGGQFDPSGYVKGWAIEQASRRLIGQNIKTFCIGAGGDINAKSDSEKIWRLGIQNPRWPNEIIAKISAKNLALATSGTYEKGSHIINPKTGRPAAQLLSLSVAGPSIIKADIYATAAFAMGKNGLNWLNQKKNYGALAVAKDGSLYMTSAMQKLLD